MLRKVEITDGGDSNHFKGDQVEYADIKALNAKLEAEDKFPVQFERQLLGITKASSGNGKLYLSRVFPGNNPCTNCGCRYW